MNSEKSSQARICFLGESFVNGTGDPECLGWTGRVCADVNRKGNNITYYNLGVRGETTTELKLRYLQELKYRLPQECDGRVVFSFGVNDTFIKNDATRVSLVNSIIHTREILKNTKALYPVLMVSPPPVLELEHNHKIRELSKHFELTCKRLEIPYLDVFSILEKSQTWKDEIRGNDGSHPRAGGYTEFSELVKTWDAWLNWFPNLTE
ncbi:GDSL-type esterase/lipase family protein [Calothrix sp. PCC 6303]|uniref:GDSL-type esterase/lipase family protein n=1 Tax=Calothrix sp. PCC 6303 TaxID=1170562 RepID=UPI0002A0347D|nr:GDSL-type esterase/lipase family protein [Calothrix sp. PCC 6303]AFZ01989.1 lipolytic protein G-D-S-L family [Calothrix sp. PCC 6303]